MYIHIQSNKANKINKIRIIKIILHIEVSLGSKFRIDQITIYNA